MIVFLASRRCIAIAVLLGVSPLPAWLLRPIVQMRF